MEASIPMEVFESPEELKDLEELQFPSQIISEFARKRKKYENKLAWPSLENYIEYIATERRLLALVTCKDRALEKTKIMEGRLIKKINRLYKEARAKMGDDYLLLMDYYQFLKEVKAKTRAKEIIELLMEKYPEKEEVFLAAITWYIQTHNPDSVVRYTIDKALTHHPTSKDLFIEAFTFELKKGHLNEDLIEKINSYTDLFFKNTTNIDHYFEVLDTFNSFQQKNRVKEYFEQKIIDVCKEEPAYYENLVKREGSTAKKQLKTKKKHRIAGLSAVSTPEQKMSQCISIYEQGLATVPENKKSDLWGLYLKFLLDKCSYVRVVGEDEENFMRVELNFVSEKFEQAHIDKYLTEELYFFWLELDKRIRCQDGFRVADGMVCAVNFEIFEKALQIYPQSIRLWKAYLSAIINHDETYDVTTIFERAIAAVPENAAQFWLIFLSYCEQFEEKGYIDTVYLKAMEDPPIALAVARKYLNWVYFNHGIEECREVYDSLVERNLQCKEVHHTMLKFEFMEFDGGCVRWEQVYENSLEVFPHDVDMWMDYMQFHIEYKRSSEETVSALYTRALASLPASSQLLLRQRTYVQEN